MPAEISAMVNRDIQIFTLKAASPAEFVAFHFTLACVSLVLHALMHASKDGVHPELLDKRFATCSIRVDLWIMEALTDPSTPMLGS